MQVQGPSNMPGFYWPKTDKKDDYVTAVCEEIKVSNDIYDRHQKFILTEAGQSYENEDGITEAAEKIMLAVRELEEDKASGF